MKLFDTADASRNILPTGGIVHYYGSIFGGAQANIYYKDLLETIAWRNDEAMIFGKKIVTKRKVAWYGEKQFEYTYSKVTKRALPFTQLLHALKERVEEASGESYNSCLLNLYHNGDEGMAWHSDGEKDLKRHGAIASLSFGAERKFSFKNKKTKERVDIFLEHGSLLVMKGTTQEHWLHRLPPSKRTDTPRINLTFRTIMENPSDFGSVVPPGT